MINHPYSIGIDPGTNTGVAVYDREEKKLIEVATVDFWSCVFDINIRFPPEIVHRLIIELPETTHVWHKKAKKRGAIEKTALNVGKSLREAELLVAWGERAGYKVVTQKPRGKIKDDDFRRITGWNKRSSQHARDAGMLCYGV